MSSPYIGEIRMFGGSFAPLGWALCDGQLLPISENPTLFQLIGTIYGGDGQDTFALPDLRGRIPIHNGQGPGVSSNYILGEIGGTESVTLTSNQIPVHTHAFMASTSTAGQAAPSGGSVASNANVPVYKPQPPTAAMNAQTIASSGGSQPHDNMAPFLCVNFIIALEG